MFIAKGLQSCERECVDCTGVRREILSDRVAIFDRLRAHREKQDGPAFPSASLRVNRISMDSATLPSATLRAGTTSPRRCSVFVLLGLLACDTHLFIAKGLAVRREGIRRPSHDFMAHVSTGVTISQGKYETAASGSCCIGEDTCPTTK